MLYASAEIIWLRIRLNNAGKYCDFTLKIMEMFRMCAKCGLWFWGITEPLFFKPLFGKEWPLPYSALLNKFLIARNKEEDVNNI